MNKERLKELLVELKDLVSRLETEVYADKDSYLSSPTLNIDYDEVLKYYQVNDNDGDGI